MRFYNTIISDYADVCPNCGVKTESAIADNTSAAKKTNVLAIVGFVLSFLVPLAGLICSIVARKQCTERNEGGAGLALAGLIISIVEMCIILLYIIILIAVAGSLVSSLSLAATVL